MLVLIDAMCWLVAWVVLLGARYDFTLDSMQLGSSLFYVIAALLLQVVFGYAFQLYRGRYRIGSFDGALLLTLVVGATALGAGLIGLIIPNFSLATPNFPRGLIISVPPTALCLMMAGRWVLRVMRERSTLASELPTSRALVYGAGDAGLQVYRLARLANPAPFTVVGFIDDDPMKRIQHFGSARVLGNGAQLERVAEQHEIDTIVLAITGVDGDFIRDLNQRADAAGLRLLMLPPLTGMLRGRMSDLNQLHEVDVTDLLGRPPIHTDLRAITDLLRDKVVLVTGAGGSIGSEIARQVHKFRPKELVLLDRDESALHAVQLSLYGVGLLDTRDMVLCDIRDHEALSKVFHEHKPEVVFHAAALKHFPMLEMYPDEAWKTNVMGSLNVLKCAVEVGARRFVNISTDKAADPSTVLGITKRTAEQLTSWFAGQGHGSFVSVRFGNVLGSRGSVIHTFRRQINAGMPVTVTDPDVERFFMTIPEACELTLQAAALGEPGDVLVLDMGTPVRILDVARQLIETSGKDAQIVFTGLRPGEKITEVLFSENEDATPTSHELIKHVHVPELSPAQAVEKWREATMTAEPQVEPAQPINGAELTKVELVEPTLVEPIAKAEQ